MTIEDVKKTIEQRRNAANRAIEIAPTVASTHVAASSLVAYQDCLDLLNQVTRESVRCQICGAGCQNQEVLHQHIEDSHGLYIGEHPVTSEEKKE